MRVRFRAVCCVAAALATAVSTASADGGAAPVTIEVRARQLAPGEPVRVDVISRLALAELEGEFLDRSVFLVRSGVAPDGSERWSGWAMVALDDPPGLAAIEVYGTSASGRRVGGTRAVTIERRDFPEENLPVAPRYVEPPKEDRRRIAEERELLARIYAVRRPAFPERSFVRPVDGSPTSIFGTRRLFNGRPRSPHPGLDLRAAEGTPVACSGPGVVVLARGLYYAGKTVIVDHGSGLFTLYAHLSALSAREGEEVRAGQIIGLSGATGRVTGPHLHWGAKIGDRPFDPTALLDASLFVVRDPLAGEARSAPR